MLKLDSEKECRTDEDISRAVASFSTYSMEIRSIMSQIIASQEHDKRESVLESILNGNASAALKRLVPKEIRRLEGLFFTGTAIAEQSANKLAAVLKKGFKILDPACGAGNLLLACARHLPIGGNLHETLAVWSKLVLGYDRHPEFIQAAQIRLALLALILHWDEKDAFKSIVPDQVFVGLKAGDAFLQSPVERDTCIIVNPPFGHIQVPRGHGWSTGRVQIAAVFLQRLLDLTPDGVQLVAILPDVLRSGTRYEKWRRMVATSCSRVELELAGQFDQCTDVDVFIMHATRARNNTDLNDWPMSRPLPVYCNHTVADFFAVHVGSVVPHRDLFEGPSHPYVHARTAPAWTTIDQLAEERRYKGKVFEPPFVVVHRTSGPNDRNRCVATIINERRCVAVENHLLVLLPHDKSLESCRQLIAVLKSPATDNWINYRIRCRHLTVSSMQQLPCPSIAPSRSC